MSGIAESESVIAYDAGPAKPQPTGVGIYVSSLAASLLARYPERVRLIGARRDGPLAASAATLMRGARHQVWVQRYANRDVAAVGGALVHYTNAVAPLRSVRPFVLTIQDLSLIRFPHYHPRLRLVSAPLMVIAAHRARRVIAPSRATADELVRVLRLPARKIDVIGVAPSRTTDTHPVDEAQADAALVRFGLEPLAYVLSVGTLEPRKNTVRLVRAFELLAAQDPRVKLVLVGDVGWRTQAIERSLERSPVRQRIVRLGYVSEADRDALMARAAVFAYVSLYEGYGLPVIEAMAAGCAVVTSRVSSMPEAAGSAAVLADPASPRDIARALRDAMSRRRELVDAGRERVAGLSWDRVAQETMAVYETALRGR